MRRHFVGLLIAVVTYKVALLCVPFVDFQVGRGEARWDTWQGKHQFRRSIHRCIDAEATRKWERRLAERFGFGTLTVKDDSLRTDGYNEFQQEEFDRLFGPDALKKEKVDFLQRWMHELREYATEER